MNWHYTFHICLLIVSASISTILAFYVWRKRSGSGSIPFVCFLLAGAEWSLASILIVLAGSLEAKVFWTNVQYLGAVAVPALWLLFSLQYTGHTDKWFVGRYPALLAIEPVAMLALVWTNPWHRLVQSSIRLDTAGPFPALATTQGPAFWLHIAYAYTLLALGSLLIIRHTSQLRREQVSILLTGILTPWIVNLIYLLQLVPFDPTPVAFTMSGLAFAWGLLRYQLLDEVPTAHDTIIQSIRDAIIVLDTQNRMVEINPAARRLAGLDMYEAIGQPIAQVFNWPELTDLENAKVSQVETSLTNGKGETYFDIQLSPLYQGQNLVGHLAVLRDITERKRAERERERLIEELDAFAHTVAHDLKNPLSTILGYSMMLKEDLKSLPEEDVAELLGGINRNSRKMNNIIDELLTLSGVRKIERVPCNALDMTLIVAEAHHRIGYMIEEYKATLVFPKHWPVAYGYGPWVEEIWVNYLSNAIKYGGIPPHIKLGATEQDDGMVRFWVRDNGPGLTPEQQAKLFTQFTRLHETRAQGHGLGLSIVQRIAEKLGGEVGVESTPDQGSTFSFTLPGAAKSEALHTTPSQS